MAEELLKTELKPSVKDHAANLEAQVKETVERLGFYDLETFLKEADIESIRRVRVVIAGLDKIRQTGEMPEAFSTEGYEKNFDDMLDRFAAYDAIAEMSDFDRANWFKAEIAKLPNIPYIVFKDDPCYLQSLFDRFIQKFGEGKCRSIRGVSVTAIFGRSLEDLDSIEARNKITQFLDLSEVETDSYRLGFNLNGGNLQLAGKYATAIGSCMKNGYIRSNMLGSFAGEFMEGGNLVLDKTGNYLGKGMKGGEISVDDAGTDIGANATGGKIFIHGSYLEYDENSKAEIYFKGKRIH